MLGERVKWGNSKRIVRHGFLLMLLLWGTLEVGYGQRARMYADWYGTYTAGILGNSTVSNSYNAVGANEANIAAVLSASGLGGSAKLQLKFLRFGQNIPSGIVVRVKVGSTTTNLNTTFSSNATSSTDVDGINEVPITPSVSGSVLTLSPNQAFNAVALSIGAGTLGAEREREVYHAYIEPYTLPLTLKNTSFTSCGPIGINDLLNYATPDLLDYEIIDNATGLAVESGHYINVSGNYKIRMTDPGTNDPTKESPSFAVTINPVPEIELSETYIRLPINTSQAQPTVRCTGCSASVWKHELDNTQTHIPTRSTAGITVYTVNVSNGSCTAQKKIVVDVYDPNYECGQKERKYATIAGGTLNVSNAGRANDGDPATYSTLTSIVVLGIGGANQTIRWNQTVPAGTIIYVKAGIGAGLLGLANTVSLQQKNGSNNVGSSMIVSGGLIDLLAGDNDFIYSFTTSAPIDGVTLSMTGVLGVGLSVNLYDAWYEVPSVSCPVDDVVDVLSGSA